LVATTSTIPDSTVGAHDRDGFTASQIQKRQDDLIRAVRLMEDIKQQKTTIQGWYDLLLENLPLELREMVYNYILPAPSVKGSGGIKSFPKSPPPG
jgi:hypothetical protein